MGVTVRRKGQKELTMIISLVILLVVAVVTISLFLQFFGSKPPVGEDAIEMAKFESKCLGLCTDVEAAFSDKRDNAIWAYCTYSASLQKSQGTDLIVEGPGFYAYCRDEAHCFNEDASSCMAQGFVITPQMCLQTMCKLLINSGESQEEAEQIIKEEMPSGNCNLRKGTTVSETTIRQETWWEKYFENPDCSGISGGGGNGGGSGVCEGFCLGKGHSGATDDECIAATSCNAPYIGYPEGDGGPCTGLEVCCCED